MSSTDVNLPSTSQTNDSTAPKSTEQFTKDGFKVLSEATRQSTTLPMHRNYDFYNVSGSFRRIMDDEGNEIMHLMNRIMRRAGIEVNMKNRSLTEKIELLIEANDTILENVANNIDEMNGIRKVPQEPVVLQTVTAEIPVNGSWNRPAGATFTVNSAASGTQQSSRNKSIQLITAKNIIRPQKFFKDKIENSNNYPWCPRITDKPNSLKPLAIFLEEFENRQEYSHPYEFELERFTPSWELNPEIPSTPKLLTETPLIEVQTIEDLQALISDLRGYNEIAVDVEHHSYRSFMGITCLLQISTPDKDYLIDTFSLRDKLHLLNEIFTKSSILKVFHSADHDIEWLQRDLSLYVVNMFDTYQAAKMLEYSSLSLAFLLRKFCNIVANKEFQLADWRIRPLPEALKTYARTDTHYLIYVYKRLKVELLQKSNQEQNLLKAVFLNSTEVCKKRYFKPILDQDSHLKLYQKGKKMFDNRQLYALREIYAWRDHLAREEDESLGYVLPNHMLLQIAETLPREMQGILASCNPIPPLVRSHLLEIHQIILKAREQPLEKAILRENTGGRGELKDISKLNINSTLYCPHDLNKDVEMGDNLQTLFANDENLNLLVEELKLECKSSQYNSIFGAEKSAPRKHVNSLEKINIYLSPYERYKLIKPLVQDEEEKRQEAEKVQLEEVTIEVTAEEGVEHPKQAEDTEGSPQKRNRGKQKGPTPASVNFNNQAPIGFAPRNQSQFGSRRNEPPPRNPMRGFPQFPDNTQRFQNMRRNVKKNERKTPGVRIETVPFDYTSVDFRQFQGGAKNAKMVNKMKHYPHHIQQGGVTKRKTGRKHGKSGRFNRQSGFTKKPTM